MKQKKKLIEVALPLNAINKASVRENYIYRGNPSSLHKWWAQRPLAAARAVIFAQMVDDPSAHADLFPDEKTQARERNRLFKIIERLVQWENLNDERVLQEARDEIWQSWRATCAEQADHPDAKEVFDRHILPGFSDPFAGGGTLPLEAQRLGLIVRAGDLNPVAVLINKAMIEIAPAYASKRPINPSDRSSKDLMDREWLGARGLAADVRYYGRWMCDEASKRIGHLYPAVRVTAEMAADGSDLQMLVGKELEPTAWLWVRTVKSPNPAFSEIEVPLASTFMLSTRSGGEAYILPVIESNGYHFEVRKGKPSHSESIRRGTKLARGANFECLMSGAPISGDYIKAEAAVGRMHMRLMAIAVEGPTGRTYLPASHDIESAALAIAPEWAPEGSFVKDARAFTPFLYGIEAWSQLFTARQLVALDTFTALVDEARARVAADLARLPSAEVVSPTGSAVSYPDAVALLLAFAVDKYAMYGNSLVPWYTKEDRPSMLFSRQVLPMVWDFAEVNPLSPIGGSLAKSLEIVAGALDGLPTRAVSGVAVQQDASAFGDDAPAVVSTDPPYYDNVPYADLSDFFYVWLRRTQRSAFPDLFATLETPKAQELVATPYRHGGPGNAEAFFLEGMTAVMHRLATKAHPAFPVTIYYAFKQSAESTDGATLRTGWATFLDAVVHAGFSVTGTWPMRTERTGRMRDNQSNALASSIVLVCRPRSSEAKVATRPEFVEALKSELRTSLVHLREANIAPVDLAQAAIGPGIAVYSRYARVVDAAGESVSVRSALALINDALDEELSESEGDFDPQTRWALAWFESYGFGEGEYGIADQLSKSKDASITSMVEARFLIARRGKVHLLKPSELPDGWNPFTDARVATWEIVHRLINALEVGGEPAAAVLLTKLGSRAESARQLAYRLYMICERKKRAAEAMSYNALVQSWPEITRLAQGGTSGVPTQAELFAEASE